MWFLYEVLHMFTVHAHGIIRRFVNHEDLVKGKNGEFVG